MEAGADSVYMGALYNARMRARNFTLDELGKAIAYCRKSGVRSYIVLNTIMFEAEIPQVAQYIRKVYEMGADALIVQDLGVARIAREVAPGLELHASTQMSVHNAVHAGLLKSLGFRRIVLARELSIGQVQRIREEAGMEVEVFAHGALCYSYSGKCFFSFVQTGRSGNRGMCAQICRFPWKLYADGKEVRKGYLTSTKDLNTLQKIPQIAAAGVDCIKIEGRLKDASYVRLVVGAYRKAIDKGGFSDLAGQTARGYTEGYLFGGARKANMLNPAAQGFSGVKIGQVEKVTGRGAHVRLFGKLTRGQGIRTARSGKVVELFRIYDKNNEKEVKDATGACVLRIKTLAPGDVLFRVERAKMEDEVLEQYKTGKIRNGKDFKKPKNPAYAKQELYFPDGIAGIKACPKGALCIVPFSDEAVEAAREAGVRFSVETPRVVFDSEILPVKSRMDGYRDRGASAFVVSEPSLASAIPGFPIIVSQYANVSNSLSALDWAGFGNVVGVIASIEVPGGAASALGFSPYTGPELEVMVSENDLFREHELKGAREYHLVDPRGNRFRVEEMHGRTVVLKRLKAGV